MEEMKKMITYNSRERFHAESFRKLYDSHFAVLCLYAGRFIPDRDMCMDIVQESFLKLWLELHRYNSQNTRLRFLYTVVRNASLNAIRHENVRNAHIRPEAETEASIELEILENEIRGLLLQSIHSLPAKYAQIILLELQGHSLAEIAVLFGKSIQTIKNTKVLAVKKLKQKMGC
jgi:RNA polymerase sigma-70 factor (ECF subfamily)